MYGFTIDPSALPEATRARWNGLLGHVQDALVCLGEPQQLAATLTLTRHKRQMSRDWLGFLESVIRRGLVLIAMALKAILTRDELYELVRTRVGPLNWSRSAPNGWIDETRPESWRTHLRFTAALRARKPAARKPVAGRAARVREEGAAYVIWRPAHDERRADSADAPFLAPTYEPAAEGAPRSPWAPRKPAALALAFRLEAILRAVERPIPHALRLLRALLRPQSRDAVLACVLGRPRQTNMDRDREQVTALQRECFAAVLGDTS